MISRIDVEHIAFEEAASLVKEYRHKYKVTKAIAIVACALVIGLTAVVLWMLMS